MKTVLLTRKQTDHEGTFGTLTVDDREWKTGELPWDGNEAFKSCIPEGEYTCVWSHSPKFKWVYEVQDVPMRHHILFHAGNFCGCEEVFLKSDTDGCILLGNHISMLRNQTIVSDSRSACKEFFEYMEKMPFKLIIRWEVQDDGLE